jgi:hypothetical protein
MFHAAYHPKAPWGVNAACMLGQVTESTKLKNQVVAVARDMPMLRTYSGYASAEYLSMLVCWCVDKKNVREWHRSFAGTVDHAEKIYPQRDI